MNRRRTSAALSSVGALWLLLSACGAEGSGGPEVQQLETTVFDLAGHPSDSRCTVVPVLLGGRVRDEIDVAGEFSMVVDATRDMVSVSFNGVNDPSAAALTIEAAELVPAFQERVEIETLSARHFVVELTAGCQP